MQAQVIVEKSPEQVWDFLIEQLGSSYGGKEQLEGKETSLETWNFLSQKIQVKQRVSKLIPNSKIQLETTSSHDIVNTTFELIQNAEHTILVLQEEAQGSSKQYRIWNYKLMSLPILRRGTIKKLNDRLNRIKMMIERS